MKIKHKLLIPIIGLLVMVFLFGCQNQQKYEINYLLEDVNEIGSYQNVFKEEIINLNLKELDQFVTSKIEELKISKNYVNNKTEVNKKVIDVFFDLKEFDVQIKYQNPEIILNQKVKYLQTIDYSKVIESIPNIQIFDVKNLRYVPAGLLVDQDLELIVTNENDTNKLATLLSDANFLYQELTYDALLKEVSEYPADIKVVLKTSYDNFYQEIKKAAIKIGTSKEEQDNAYAELKVSYHNIVSEIIIGTNTEIDLDKDLLNLVSDLKQSIEEKTAHLGLFMVEKSPKAANEYYVSQEVISESLYFIYNLAIKDARQLLAKVETSNDEELRVKTINQVKKMIERLDEIYQEVETSKIVGTKITDEASYQVIVYKQKKDLTYEMLAPITISSRLYEIINYKPEQIEGYQINSEKTITNGVVMDNSLKLEIYYDLKQITVSLNLDNGTIDGFTNKHINLFYGESIDPEIVTKLKTITKEPDKYASSYTFSKYLNYGSADEFDFNSPIYSDIILQAVYDSVATSYDYQVKIFYDEPVAHSYNDELAPDQDVVPRYNNKPDQLLAGETITGGQFLQYNFTVPEGFEIDTKLSIMQYNKAGIGDDILIYLKRKLIKVSFDLDGGVIKGYGTGTGFGDKPNPRVINNTIILKAGQKLDIMLSGIRKPNSASGKYVIFDYATYFNKDTNTYERFDYNTEIKDNLHLVIHYKEVEKVIELNIYKSFKGIRIPQGSIGEHRSFYSVFIEPGQKIEDLAIFYPDSFTRAQFDLDNGLGHLLLENEYITKDHVFNMKTSGKTEIQNLYMLNHYSFSQTEKLLYNEQWSNEPRQLADFPRAMTASIVEKLNDKLLVLENDGIRALLMIEKTDLTTAEIEALQVGNEIRFTGSMTKNFRRDTTIYSHYYEYICKYRNYSVVSKVGDVTPDTTTLANTFNEDSLYKYNFDKVTILDKPYPIGNFYKTRITNLEGDVSYLYMPNNSLGVKKFLELRQNDLIDIKDGLLIKTRTLNVDNGKAEFLDNRFHVRNAIYINDYNNHLTFIPKEEVNVKVNFQFEQYDSYTSHDSFTTDVKTYKNNTLKAVINALTDDYFFNGYRFKEVLVNGQVVNLDTYVIDSNMEITIDYHKDDQVVEVYVGSYLSEAVMMEQTTLTFSYGGRTVVTRPVDYDNHFAKFIMSYNGFDEYIRCSHNFINNDFNFSIVIPKERRLEKGLIRAAIFDSMKYSIEGSRDYSGEDENPEYSLGWEGKAAWMFYEYERLILMQIMTDNVMNVGTELEGGVRFVSKNNISADGEYNLNRDHNMISDGYAKHEGNFAIRVGIKGQEMTDEEVNANNDFYVGIMEKFPIYEYQKDRYVPIGEKTVPYHKDSLTKIANFNKFGIYQVGLEVGKQAFLSKPGVTRPAANIYLVQNFDVLLNSIDNSALIHNATDYIRTSVRMAESTPNALRYQIVRNNNKTLNFRLFGSSQFTFTTNNRYEISYLNQEYMSDLNQDRLQIKNFNPNEHLVYYYRNGVNIGVPTKFDDYRNVDYNVLVFEKQNTKIRITNSYDNYDEIKLAYAFDGYNYEFITGVNKGDYYEFDLDLWFNNHSTAKTILHNFIIVNSDNEPIGMEPHFTISAYDVKSYQNNKYLFIQGGNQPLTLEDDSKLLVFAHDSENPKIQANDLRLIVKNHTLGKLDVLMPNVNILTNVAFFNYVASDSDILDQLEIYLADNNLKKLNNINLATKLEVGKAITIELDVEHIDQVVDNVISDNANVLNIKISANDESLVLPVTKLLLSGGSTLRPAKVDVSSLQMPVKDSHEIVWGVLNQRGTYDRVDLNRGFMQLAGNIDLKAFYLPIYEPGEYVRVDFRYSSDLVLTDLGKNILNNSMIIKVGDKLPIPASVLLHDEFNSYREFDGYYINNQKIDPNTYMIESGDQNISVDVRSKLKDGKVMYRYIEYFENQRGEFEEKVNRLIPADAGTLIKYLPEDLDNQEGYQVFVDNSTLEGTASDDLVIKVYYSIKEYEIKVYLEGGVMNPTYPGDLVYDEDLGYILIKAKYQSQFSPTTYPGIRQIVNDTRGYPIKENYKFERNARYEYYLNGNLISIVRASMPSFRVENDVNIYMVYTKQKLDQINYDFTYYLENKENVGNYPDTPITESMSVEWDTLVDKTNFHLGYEPDEAYNATNNLTQIIKEEGVQLIGHFKRKIFTVTFDLNGGNWEGLVEAQEIRYENLLTLPAGTPSVDGANFQHFLVNGEVVSDLSTVEVKEDLLIEAIFDKVEYKVEIYKENSNNEFELVDTLSFYAELNSSVEYQNKIDGFTLLTNYKDTKLSGTVTQGLVLKAYYMIRPSDFGTQTTTITPLSLANINLLEGPLKFGPYQNMIKEER